jgi:hypothetical protein
MTWLYLTAPLMVAAIAIAVVPVLVGSLRHNRTPERPFGSVEQESDFWHHMLGHRAVEDHAPTPELIETGELLRVMGRSNAGN